MKSFVQSVNVLWDIMMPDGLMVHLMLSVKNVKIEDNYSGIFGGFSPAFSSIRKLNTPLNNPIIDGTSHLILFL